MKMNDNREVKQVIVFRKDLLKGENAIRKGKFAAQVCHASLSALLSLFKQREIWEDDSFPCVGTKYELDVLNDSYLDKWLNGIFTKICLSVNDNDELLNLYAKIKKERPDIPCVLITDCGKTEFNNVPTNTCIGIGPFWSDEIDVFTKDLKLL